MKILRSSVVFLWIALSIVPPGLGLLLCSPLLSGQRLWWTFAVPWLRGAIAAARLLGGVRYRVHGREHLPAASDMRPIVLAAKHQSTWETFFLPTLAPHPLSFVLKKELARVPVFGWAIRHINMIQIDRKRSSQAWHRVAAEGARLMAEGNWIILFPEGTRSARGARGRYKTGAARLALETGAEIIPVAVTSARCWPRRSFWFIPGTIDVSIGAPMQAAGRDADTWTRDIEAWIEGEMRRLDPEAYTDHAG